MIEEARSVLRILRKTLFWIVFVIACWFVYGAVFPTNESFAEMVDRAELWCEKNYGPRPAPTGGKPELTEFDDCVDAEVRLYTGSQFGVFLSGLFGGVIVVIYIAFWGVRFMWKRYRRYKRIKQNPYS